MKRCLPPRTYGRQRQRGLALVCALMMMLGALILGASVARTAFASMASARLERDRLVARAAAEAALADAQADIEGGTSPSSARAGWLAAGSGGFADGCGYGAQDLGLCLPAPPGEFPVWQRVDLAADDAPLVPYGRYTGAMLATGAGILPARLPGYLIEKIEPATAGAVPPPSGLLYRITAIGYGTRAATRVVLQAVVRTAALPAAGGDGDEDSAEPVDAAAGESPVPGTVPVAEAPAGPPAGPAGPPAAAPPDGRVSWREIANWPELHARAMP